MDHMDLMAKLLPGVVFSLPLYIVLSTISKTKIETRVTRTHTPMQTFSHACGIQEKRKTLIIISCRKYIL